ncbi:hypothetical protein G3N55_05275 [Dissulfurirhabdus thermomarina]|uniref:Doubled CXXCH motif domain-containing protein n=1 Tax=Dissulfurirhabdus thermomarina TaxID=1765737 RepID=A0A6N9TR73_DISTH|nr:cytochrome c3 family protein [Dissulfurirhabdus thermomarina]NDY42254.1 hypothetical protein [Dissulfurirhabdus thermomarina]NMX22985.1 hypothetical protein [Dissulfurirhabdus thermomarina]
MKWIHGAGCLLAALALAASAAGRVQGPCADCHTMHESQDGGPVAAGGPHPALTRNDCVGCHSNAGSATIVQLGGGERVPIVNNAAEPAYPPDGSPSSVLAGGNFHWVAAGDDTKGHNVRGISAADQFLSEAPGRLLGYCGDTSCHVSLTLPDPSPEEPNGCQGCHQTTRHHGTDPPGEPVPAEGGWYRFLSNPVGHAGFGGRGVLGIEDPDWEQAPTPAAHNIYYGGDGSDTEYPQSISKFCAGCHYHFHSPGFPTEWWGTDNGGGDSPWLRHPTNYAIPLDGEFAPLFDNATAYNPLVPVAKPNLAAFDAARIEPGDQVACVSCHRAHGSPYPDMLRWDYQGCAADVPNPDCGCFFCHTQKDG